MSGWLQTPWGQLFYIVTLFGSGYLMGRFLAHWVYRPSLRRLVQKARERK